MKRNNFLIIIICILFAFLFPNSWSVKASPPASLFLLPDKSTYLDPEKLILELNLNTNQATNAILFGLSYNPSYIKLTDLKINNSICPIVIWKMIDNKNGQANFICGTPGSIIDENNNIADLTFNKLQTGFTKLRILDYSVITASDGHGTNILTQHEVHNIYIYK
jgi:hypothetical protein